jgi:hypothetical protein
MARNSPSNYTHTIDLAITKDGGGAAAAAVSAKKSIKPEPVDEPPDPVIV